MARGRAGGGMSRLIRSLERSAEGDVIGAESTGSRTEALAAGGAQPAPASGPDDQARRKLGSAASGSAGICDEASESQNSNTGETEDAGSLQQPPVDSTPTQLDGHSTGEG